MDGLHGLNVVLQGEKRRKQTILGDRTTVRGDRTALRGDDILDELMGFDISTVSPYLSAFAGGFGGGDKKEDPAAAIAKMKQEQLEKEKEAAESRSRTTIFVVVGLVGVAAAGTIAYLVARKK